MLTTARIPFDLALSLNNNSVEVADRIKSIQAIEAIKQNKIGAGARKT